MWTSEWVEELNYYILRKDNDYKGTIGKNTKGQWVGWDVYEFPERRVRGRGRSSAFHAACDLLGIEAAFAVCAVELEGAE